MKISFFEHIKKYISLSDEEWQDIAQYFTRNTVRKKENLLFEGQVCRDLHFVEEGCLRMFYVNAKQAEQITQFALEGWWLTDYKSFSAGTTSDYYIQAIEKSTITSIDSVAFENLLKFKPELERYFRIIFQKNIAVWQLRSRYVNEMSKEEFYFHFSQMYPEFMQRVPQYMVASYLGLTPEYLSELRRKI